MSRNHIAVIGAGSWGTALSMVLADNNHNVMLYSKEKKHVEEINEQRTNKDFLPGITIPEKIVATNNVEEALNGTDIVLLVVPTKAIRSVCQQIKNIISKPITIIHASKGIEPGSFKRISEMIVEEVPQNLLGDVVVLSGPSHAEEVSLQQPTTVTSASSNMDAAAMVQRLFMNNYFRVYTNPDVIGVELGGAIKNIIALGAGVSHGLGYGDNAKAALITRGLAEIKRLGAAMGAKKQTFSGLTGVGDLIVTCTSVHSRNFRAGKLIGQGRNFEEVENELGMVVEGIRTTEAAYHLAKSLHVEMPITDAIYNVLFNGKDPKEAVDDLMIRVGKDEANS
ncbi:NAD(P)H-dependent glycerol-3-phosphate dehydrogenase [Aquibacillus koreensis]|uniref:Glycerol-3-phosphate dehydrogenase [NAD(P)+] n=1 Tax=Aquibacillus koreensis TaxID=279446 RepID=A0A9X4AH59_9BACI|nr:NAD(P)H-dependent glycerol-3-phosphate dehydrogenase [Aquibacillus koreensis]MCT2535286.1 NAD(P)H-dependent glycerol-3-phosphate dehydrogenase [Aquibacillus koreensis]MDC3419782.1 NAD(P)H-dependent glycerol-3-phosphate dehydrogenase [Aquibacillus koreensis]